MPVQTLTGFVHRLAVAGDSDGALVRRFADERCEEAFAELVRRFGPAVFGVCRRTLGDHHLAEDAFQAVFVVLARKADTIRPPGAVGGWLYGVARKAAVEAGAMRRRKNRESLPGSLPDVSAISAEPDDTAEVVDAEIANLPPILRSAVLLCEIEGVGRAEAAKRLGIAPGTLSSRLAAARKLLAKQLRRRGLGAMVLGIGATVPESLARAASSRANGKASGAIQELSHGVLRTMLISKLKLTPMVVVGVALAGALFATSQEPRLQADTSRTANVGLRLAPVPAPVPDKAAGWKVQFTLPHDGSVTGVAACGDLIAAAADIGTGMNYVRFWNATDGKASDLQVTKGGFNAPVRFNFVRFTNKDNYLIVGSEFSGTRYRRRPGGIATDGLGSYDLLACSANMNTLIIRRSDGWAGGEPNQMFLHVDPWEVRANFLKHHFMIEEDCETLTHATVSWDDRRFAVVGDDAVVRVYDRETLKVLHRIELPKKTGINAIQFSDDAERLAVVGAAGFAKLFDKTGAEVCDLKGHTGKVTGVAFAPDGKQLVTANGKLVRLFETAKGKPVAELAGHEDAVVSVAFSTDGKRIVSGSADKTAKVWERK